MTCTTFLHDGELNQPVPQPEIQILIDTVRKVTGQNWQVVPLPARRVGLFRRQAQTLYGVYVYVGGIGPWQQINFYREGSKSSINLYVPLEVVAAYFYGLWNGAAQAKESDHA